MPRDAPAGSLAATVDAGLPLGCAMDTLAAAILDGCLHTPPPAPPPAPAKRTSLWSARRSLPSLAARTPAASASFKALHARVEQMRETTYRQTDPGRDIPNAIRELNLKLSAQAEVLAAMASAQHASHDELSALLLRGGGGAPRERASMCGVVHGLQALVRRSSVERAAVEAAANAHADVNHRFRSLDDFKSGVEGGSRKAMAADGAETRARAPSVFAKRSSTPNVLAMMRKICKSDAFDEAGAASGSPSPTAPLSWNAPTLTLDWRSPKLPSHPLLAMWSKLMAFAVAYVAVWVPMQAAFDEDLGEPQVFWFIVNVAVDLIFVLDMLVVFNTAYKEQGMWVYDRSKIAARYIKSSFMLDLISSFPYSLLVTVLLDDYPWESGDGRDLSLSGPIRAVRLLRLFRVVIKLMRNGSHVAQAISGAATRFNPSFVRVSQLVIMLWLACHWVGCAWWLVGTLREPNLSHERRDWGPDEYLRHRPFGIKYAHSFNWGAGMVLAYVPKDVEPEHLEEVIVTCISMFLGFFMGMIFISAATTALQLQDSKSAISQQKLEKIWRYLSFKRVPISLCSRILEFYEYSMTSSVTLSQMEEFRELPPSMDSELTMELNRNVLQECPLWAMLPWPVVIQLMAELSPVVFPPYHVIVVQGFKSPGLYFIEQGMVSVNIRDSERGSSQMTFVKHMGKSEFFGESSLLAVLHEALSASEAYDGVANPRSSSEFSAEAKATIRTECYCDMLLLANSDFARVIMTHPEMESSIADIKEALARNKSAAKIKKPKPHGRRDLSACAGRIKLSSFERTSERRSAESVSPTGIASALGSFKPSGLARLAGSASSPFRSSAIERISVRPNGSGRLSKLSARSSRRDCLAGEQRCSEVKLGELSRDAPCEQPDPPQAVSRQLWSPGSRDSDDELHTDFHPTRSLSSEISGGGTAQTSA